MSARLAPLFRAATVEWGTPPDLYASLDAEFGFDLDPCPSDGIWDGRLESWAGRRVFCNPPYGRGVDTWLAKGSEADVAVFLLPARTDTAWFHDHALRASEIRFFRGRLRFRRHEAIRPHVPFSGEGAPFPSMLVIYRSVAGA